MIPAPSPGVYRNCAAEYYQWDAISNTMLGWIKESPARFQHCLHTPEKDTAAMLLGRKMHDHVLFGAPLPDSPEKDTKTARTEWETLCGTVTALRNDPLVSAMLKRVLPNHRELAIVWDDAETGVRCKALLDSTFPYQDAFGVTKFGILDLKGTQDASPAKFGKAVYEYGYHRQCAQYWEAGLSVPLDIGMFVFAAVEKCPPYPVICYEVDEETRGLGKWERYKMLRRYQECQQSGVWPGYSDGKRFHKISMPAWAKKEIESL